MYIFPRIDVNNKIKKNNKTIIRFKYLFYYQQEYYLCFC